MPELLRLAVDGTMAVAGYPPGSVVTAAAGSRDKAGLFAAAAARTANSPPAPPAGHPRRLNHDMRLFAEAEQVVQVPGMGEGELRAYGTSLALAPFWDTEKHKVAYVDSSSQVAWLGTSPFRADKIIHTDTWVTDIYGGEAQISGGPPGAVAGPSCTLEWTTEVSDNWFSRHDWPEAIAVIAEGATYQVGFKVMATFQFGSCFFEVTGGQRGGI